MVVHRHRVGALDAVQERAAAGDQQAAAVRGVHVHPGAVPGAQVGDLGQRVDAAEVGGARGGDDGHRDQALGRAAGQLGGERVGPHPLVRAARHRDHGFRAEAQQGGGLLDAEVADLGGEDAQPGQDVGTAYGSCGALRVFVRVVLAGEGRAAGLVAGQQHGLEVGLGAAAGEDAVGALAEADAAGGPVDQTALDEGAAGALVPGVQRGVDRGQHRLADQGGDDDRAVEVREVARVVEVDGVAEVDLFELVEGGGGVVQRLFEVDAGHRGGEAVDRDAGEGAFGGGYLVGHAGDAFGDGAAVVLGGAVVEQLRPAVRRPGGCGGRRVLGGVREETHERVLPDADLLTWGDAHGTPALGQKTVGAGGNGSIRLRDEVSLT